MAEQASPDQAQVEAQQENRRRFAAAALIAAVAVSTYAYIARPWQEGNAHAAQNDGTSLQTSNADGSSALGEAAMLRQMHPYDEKLRNPTQDPRERATSIVIYTTGSRTSYASSGSLVEAPDGNYRLATIEHATEKFDPVESAPIFYVPKVGAFDLTSAPDFIGMNTALWDKKIPNKLPDRYTEYTLSPYAQTTIAKAVANHTLEVPKKADLHATFGEQFSMPLANTGKEVPFVYAYFDEASGEAVFVPLVILDEKLDYKTGMTTFRKAIKDAQVQMRAQGLDPAKYPTKAIANAMWALAEQTFVKYAHGPDEQQLANNTVAMGDSGSAMLDPEGNDVGALSLGGEPFVDPAHPNDPSAGNVILRVDSNGKFNADTFCLPAAFIATGSYSNN